MSLPSNLTERVRRAIYLTLEITEDHLLGFSPSVPKDVEKGSEEHRKAIKELRGLFAEENWLYREGPEGKDELAAIGLTPAQIATVKEALIFISEGMIHDRLFDATITLNDAQREHLTNIWRSTLAAKVAYGAIDEDDIVPLIYEPEKEED